MESNKEVSKCVESHLEDMWQRFKEPEHVSFLKALASQAHWILLVGVLLVLTIIKIFI